MLLAKFERSVTIFFKEKKRIPIMILSHEDEIFGDIVLAIINLNWATQGLVSASVKLDFKLFIFFAGAASLLWLFQWQCCHSFTVQSCSWFLLEMYRMLDFRVLQLRMWMSGSFELWMQISVSTKMRMQMQIWKYYTHADVDVDEDVFRNLTVHCLIL